MVKPWEEDWEVDPSTEDPLMSVRRSVDPGNGFDRGVARRMTEEEARFIAAAPDMARALVAFIRGLDGSEAGVDLEQARLDAETALTKAGVPL